MTLHPDEQAREFVKKLMEDAAGPNTGSLQGDAEAWPGTGIHATELIALVAALLSKARLAEAELIRDEYLDAGGWELVNQEDFDAHVAELVRQAAGERTK